MSGPPWLALNTSQDRLPADWNRLIYGVQYMPFADNLSEIWPFRGGHELTRGEAMDATASLLGIAKDFRQWAASPEYAILPRYVWLDRISEPTTIPTGYVLSEPNRMLVVEDLYLNPSKAAAALAGITDLIHLLGESITVPSQEVR